MNTLYFVALFRGEKSRECEYSWHAGSCECYAGYESADCSVSANSAAPRTSLAWQYGLCDVRTMNCSHVIVYGTDFINSPNLTCHFQETKVRRLH